MNRTKKLYSNSHYLYFLLFFWAIIFSLEYLYRNGIPFFLCNDSFQYLSIAHKIYLSGKINGATNYAIDIYYDEIALFGYDLSNIKPYHFPSYSIFLSLFYHIFENHNFVIYASQYIAFIIFSFSSFLVLNQYLDKNKSLVITLVTMVSTPIILYISDCGKEILLSGLSLLVFYFGLYHKNKYSLKVQFFLCFILTLMSITRNFYLVLALLIFFYNCLPRKFLKIENSESENRFKNNKQIILYFVLIFLIPLCAYIFCYYFLDLHLFIYDNRTDIYGGKSLKDLGLRVFFNLYIGVNYYFIQYIQFIFVDNFKIKNLNSLFHLYAMWGISIITLGIYFLEELKNIRTTRTLKISKLLIIKIFFGLIVFSVIVRFSLNGYRLTTGFMPIIYYYLYQKFFYGKKLIQKKFFIFFLIINIIFIASFIKTSKHTASYFDKLNQNIKNIISLYNAKKIALNVNYTPSPHLSPMYHYYSPNIYFFTSIVDKNLCEDLANYHEHYLDFHLIFMGYGNKIIMNYSQNNCDFIIKNFELVDINQYGLVYANKSILKR